MLKFCDYVKTIFSYIVFTDTKVIGTFPQPKEDLPKNRNDFIDYVNTRLARFRKQRLTIKEFYLDVECFELCYMSKDVDLWLKLASESGVEVLEICNDPNNDKEGRGECYVLPKSVIEAKSLTKLVLTGKIRVDQAFMNHSFQICSLKELYLLNVHLEDEQAIKHLISYCPLIEIISLMLFHGSMKSLSMHGLQKLRIVDISGIKEVYIDEAPSIKSFYYNPHPLDTPFKVDFIRCKNLKELTICLINSNYIITDNWFLELFTKFPFLEMLDLQNCTMSEKINILSVQLKKLKFTYCSNLKEAIIDAPNLELCGFNYYDFDDSKPIISFLRISSQLIVHVEINVKYFNVCYMRELLQNIKHQKVVIMVLSLFIPKTIVVSMNT
jgi:DNA-directed RNA polymerase subunit L